MDSFLRCWEFKELRNSKQALNHCWEPFLSSTDSRVHVHIQNSKIWISIIQSAEQLSRQCEHRWRGVLREAQWVIFNQWEALIGDNWPMTDPERDQSFTPIRPRLRLDITFQLCESSKINKILIHWIHSRKVWLYSQHEESYNCNFKGDQWLKCHVKLLCDYIFGLLI